MKYETITTEVCIDILEIEELEQKIAPDFSGIATLD